MARQFIEEIIKRERRHHKRPNRFQLCLMRIVPVYDAFILVTTSDTKKREDLIRYFPIAVVAFVQSYFRMVYRDLVNSGNPYSTRAREYLSKERFGIEALLDVQGKRITPGDVVAHLMKCSRLDDIDDSMSALTGCKFLAKIEHDHLMESISDEADWHRLCKQMRHILNRTFELRHMFCHEFATKEKPKLKDVRDGLDVACGLVLATERFLADRIPQKLKVPKRSQSPPPPPKSPA